MPDTLQTIGIRFQNYLFDFWKYWNYRIGVRAKPYISPEAREWEEPTAPLAAKGEKMEDVTRTPDELMREAALSGQTETTPETKEVGTTKKAQKPRRVFTEAYKEKMVKLARSQPKGKVAEFLKKHKLTPSHYYQWVTALELKENKAAAKNKPRAVTTKPKATVSPPLATTPETELLKEENLRLKFMLRQTEMLFQFQNQLQQMMAEEGLRKTGTQG